jgi:hypothetical protein
MRGRLTRLSMALLAVAVVGGTPHAAASQVAKPLAPGATIVIPNGKSPVGPPATQAQPGPGNPTLVFTVEKVQIERTRSLVHDTVWVDMDAFQQNVRTWGSNLRGMGDLGPGTYTPNLQVRFSYGDHGPLTFAYTVVNFGHDKAKIENFLVQQTAGTWLQRLGNVLFADCDGTVAAHSVTLNQTQLAQIIAGSPLKSTDFNPGTDSPTGCGGNSRYYVTWSIAVGR